MFKKVLNFFSGGVGGTARKIKASMLDSAYNSASLIKKTMRRWHTSQTDANAAYSETTQATLVSRCRDAYRNYPLATSIINRIKLSSIGSGLKLQSRLDYERLGITKEEASELERTIETKFDKWSYKCDIEDSLYFNSMQLMVLVGMLISGDIFVNTLYVNDRKTGKISLKLQAIEGDRVSNPNFVMDTEKIIRGIEVDFFGKPIYYHILKQHPYSDIMTSKKYSWQRISAYGRNTESKRVLHIFEKGGNGRPGLKRGIPIFFSILDSLRQLEKYSEAELTAAVIASFFSVFVKTETAEGLPGTTEQSTSEEEKGEISLSPGGIVNLLENESIEVANPGRPNSTYNAFVEAITREIGASLGIPYEVLTLHFSSSYSAARAALLQAWQLFKYHRQIIVDYFCQPVYELFLDGIVANGEIELKNYKELKFQYAKSKWIGSLGGSIDPVKEVDAAGRRIALGVSTIQKEAEEISNMDWLDIHRQREVEKNIRKKAGLLKEIKAGMEKEINPDVQEI